MWGSAFTKQNEQTPLLVQREVGKALRLSFEAVTREPLSEQIVLLLLRLALAEALRTSIQQEAEREAANEGRRSFRVSL